MRNRSIKADKKINPKKDNQQESMMLKYGKAIAVSSGKRSVVVIGTIVVVAIIVFGTLTLIVQNPGLLNASYQVSEPMNRLRP
jgi:hypothetical protein